MSELIVPLIVALVVSVGSFVTFYFISTKRKSSGAGSIEDSVAGEAVVREANARAKEIVLEAKNNAFKLKQEVEKETDKLKEKVLEKEKKLTVDSARLEAREKQFNEQNSRMESLKQKYEKKSAEIDGLVAEQRQSLQKIAGLSKDDARRQLVESFEGELAKEKGKLVREMEEAVKREADETAREILVYAMKQGASDYIVEHSSSKLKLPDEDMKGRIIGKEGRNIKKFEELTGVELELDSTPGEILISSFDPVRREIAKVSLERLIADGRIQPARIEDVVKKTQSEIDKVIHKEGDNLCHRLGVYNLPGEVVGFLGKFKYRFSYGQNMIEHTLEVAKMGMAIAHEVGADVEAVKLSCLLHDIGKVLDGEGGHVQLGIDFLSKHKVDKKIIDCVGEHHEDKPFSSIESVIVNVADHISGARPSARSEDYESYVKRLSDLEEIANSFDGVENVYAISAGREVRVFVKPKVVDDDSTALLAREIARKIELEQTYPGTVKVTVIRETRISETAK